MLCHRFAHVANQWRFDCFEIGWWGEVGSGECGGGWMDILIIQLSQPSFTNHVYVHWQSGAGAVR